MILDREVKIRNNGRISGYYKSIGLDVSGKFIFVPISLVTSGSHIKINCSCDICGIIKNIMYKSYSVHIKYDGLYYCEKCSVLKKKKIVNERYEVDSVTQTENFKKKSKITC